MEKIPKFNKHRAFNKAVGPGKKSKINKRRAYVYSGLQSRFDLGTVKLGDKELFGRPKIVP